MKPTRKPPNFKELQNQFRDSPEQFFRLREEGAKTEKEGKYRHWEIVRRLKPPAGLKQEEWWLGIKLHREIGMKSIPLLDPRKKPFCFNIPEQILEQLYKIDLQIGGRRGIPEALTNPHTRNQ